MYNIIQFKERNWTCNALCGLGCYIQCVSIPKMKIEKFYNKLFTIKN